MEIRKAAMVFFRKLKKKRRAAILHIKFFLKTSQGALFFTFLILAGIFYNLFKNNSLPDLMTATSLVSAVATVVICLFTAKSVSEVIKANKENRTNNQERDRKESFEKKFALLLQEHNSYLRKLVKSNNPLYKLDYILNCAGDESRSIVRGNAKIARIDGEIFHYSNNNLLVQLDVWVNKDESKIYLNPNQDSISNLGLKKSTKLPDLYASNNGFFWYLSSSGKMVEIDCEYSFLKSEGIKEQIKEKINKGLSLVPNLIDGCNDVSKNILSPYMRIIYHLLKTSKENTKDKEDMKQYTNIVRSIIPYDMLMLVAINAMYFYKSSNEKIDEVKRWSDLFRESDDLNSLVFNDYYKYYRLLIECDFFEHLIMDFSEVIEKSANIILDADISDIKITTCKTNKVRRKCNEPIRCLLLHGDVEYNLSVVFKKINEATLKLETDIIVLFFFNQDRRLDIVKENIMDDFIFRNRNLKIEGRLNEANHANIFERISVISEKNKTVVLSRNFYCLYTAGELPPILRNSLT
ncbi:putative phage abortive infection protein [Serratia fonticola]|uniref:putative phage abortive infection protein n=1 Tax=Serratia fonticola TaxID=47917 RepID=UPI003AACAE70